MIKTTNMNLLPKAKDRISFLYIEFANIEQSGYSVVALQKNKETVIPIMTINVLLLGPGTTVTHAAIKNIADAGCLIVWCGRECNKFYASGMGGTYSSKNLLLQANCFSDIKSHMQVVRNMYQLRYQDKNLSHMSLEQMRGMEGKRVKELYKALSEKYRILWNNRKYNTQEWELQDDVNKALSIGNNFLYSIMQGIIMSMGFSPAIGFIHTGRMLSFVYDIADIYKEKITIPIAFEVVGTHQYEDLDKHIRKMCKEKIQEIHLMKLLPKDLKFIFDISKYDFDIPSEFMLWDLNSDVFSGINYG